MRYDRPDNCLVFPTRHLEIAARGANPLIASQIEKFAVAFAAQAIPPPTFREGVADATRALLAEGQPTDRVAVARQLHVSWRTLQRRLEEERTSFRAIRDAVLREVVEALLSNSVLKVEAIALSVGFGEVAAFSKAFKRWTGCSPTVYRRRLAATATRRRQVRLVPTGTR
jgi:AraC-like DNA-binding protein